MKRFLLTLAVATSLATSSALAGPARPWKKQVAQSDGTQLTITHRGDEHLHYVATADGLPLVKTAQGTWHYATLSNGTLVATPQLAHDADQRSAEEQQFLALNAASPTQLRTLRSERLLKRKASAKRSLNRQLSTKALAGKTSQPVANLNGSHRGLVVLVNFKDVKFQASHTKQAYNRLMNEVGYTENDNSGSVHDYFLEQSYGKFDVTFDVVGPVTVSKNMKAYGGNDRNDNDKDPAGMVYEALKLAKQQNPSLNFADYDWDGDGEVDQVFLIYAGYGESSGTDDNPLSDTIWPHEWQLSSAGYSLSFDGVSIDTYGCSAELYGDTGTRMDGIGSPCHEFSHCLGLPDLYDTSNSEEPNFGMDYWSVMDYGCYAGDCFKPAAYTAYERWMSGWLTPTELSSAATVRNMQPIELRPEAYVIYNDAHPDEYYLLENRQALLTDSELPGHGLLVVHVDYDAAVWNANTINNTANHQRCTIIAADNSYCGSQYIFDDLDGDPYPGADNNHSLTNTSTPRATLYNKNASGQKLMSKPLTEIEESAQGLISFQFMGGGQVIDAIDNVCADSWAQPVSIYRTDGTRVSSTSPLAPGTYLLKSLEGNVKKVVK